jgi:hypothetical protein
MSDEKIPSIVDPKHLITGTLLATLVSELVKTGRMDGPIEIRIHPDGEYHVSDDDHKFDYYQIGPEAGKWLEQLKDILHYADINISLDLALTTTGTDAFNEACTMRMHLINIRKALCLD